MGLQNGGQENRKEGFPFSSTTVQVLGKCLGPWQVSSSALEGKTALCIAKTILPGPGDGANSPTQGWRIKICFTPFLMN